MKKKLRQVVTCSGCGYIGSQPNHDCKEERDRKILREFYGHDKSERK